MNKTVLIGVMVKNAERWLPHTFELLEKLSYPRELMRIIFEYATSSDRTLEMIKDFIKKGTMKAEVYQEPYDINLRKYGDGFSAAIFNDFQNMMEEDYFLLFDTDLADIPSDLIQQLMSVDGDFVGPFIWAENYDHYYDTWIARIGNVRLHPYCPAGIGTRVPFEIDAIGTVYLAKKEAFKYTPVGNPYPHLQICNNARRSGFRILLCPNIEVFHIDVAKLGILHNPLPQELGGYPNQGFYTALDPIIDINGNIVQPYKFDFTTDNRILPLEREIALRAIRDYTFNGFKKAGKSLRWTYNWHHFRTFWMTRNPELVKLMYDTEMYPSYVEIELTNKCNYRCQHCENGYWPKDVPRRDMTWDDFLLIMNDLPNLKQCSFTAIGNHWLSPIFMDAVKYVKDRDVYFEQYDTFQHFTEERANKFVKWGVERLFVSMDAATKQTYENTRVGHKWNKMIEGIKLVEKAKKRHHSKYPEINFHYVVDKNNINEAVDAIPFIKSLNIDNGFIMYSRLLHNFPEINHLYTDIPEDLKNRILEKGREEKVPVIWNVDIDKSCQVPSNMCTHIWQPFIFATGEVVPCCGLNEANVRQDQIRLSMGNVFTDGGFKAVWYGEKYRKLRQQLRQGISPEPCWSCPEYKMIGNKEKWN